MSDLLAERRLSLTALARRENISPSTVWRWTHGVRGVQLESFSVGAKRFTTCEAFARFVERTTAVAKREPLGVRTPRQREAAHNRAEAELTAAGVK